jgi:hypothetical protein
MFAREVEWSDLVAFSVDETPGATMGVVSGRRRQGKAFLLDSLARLPTVSTSRRWSPPRRFRCASSERLWGDIAAVAPSSCPTGTYLGE